LWFSPKLGGKLNEVCELVSLLILSFLCIASLFLTRTKFCSGGGSLAQVGTWVHQQRTNILHKKPLHFAIFTCKVYFGSKIIILKLW